ncbi:hypothetical protein [Streptomyces goshikiensis]|uniref:hypothetical protein n=1 Tax=Streptomyces goshikiensis TaxID=1942 RepID=UPI0036941B5D
MDRLDAVAMPQPANTEDAVEDLLADRPTLPETLAPAANLAPTAFAAEVSVPGWACVTYAAAALIEGNLFPRLLRGKRCHFPEGACPKAADPGKENSWIVR